LINLERENQLLRAVVKDLATLIKELMEVMPLNIQETEHVKRLMEVSEKLIEYGTTLPTPNHRQ
jgi:hypothetical protein